MAVTEVDEAGPSEADAESAAKELSRSIWQLTEDVLELLRSRSTISVHKHKRADLLWLDELTETQGSTVIAVRQLCEGSPEGVTLKKLAETMGVTPAAASVMVDLLVKKKMLKRTKSKNDRRAVLIRLTPETAGLFEISEESLRQSVRVLRESLGEQVFGDWHRILVSAKAALRQVVVTEQSVESESSEEETA